ncbi:MAG: dockerin type I domain-containing protein [Gammaproteobacteria bacterium]
MVHIQPSTARRPLSRVLACPLVGLLVVGLAPLNSLADHRSDVGYTLLQQELGVSIPDGTAVVVSQVEGTQLVNGQNAWMPDILDAQFAGKTITNSSNAPAGLYSYHATGVGQDFYGISTSMAPAIANISAYSAGDWIGGGFLQTVNGSGGSRPNISTNRLGNHSWVGSAGTADTYVLRRVDWLVETDEFIQVAGLNNGDGITPTTYALLAGAFNVIAVGRSDAQHAPGSLALDALYTAGRVRPDIVDPINSVSSATPHVSSAAALLIETGHANPALSTDPVAVSMTNRAGVVVRNAERSEVIKAALMAGADRVTHNTAPNPTNLDLYRGAVANQTANGLDRRYGAGQLNVRNSYWIIAGGEQNSTEDGGPGPSATGRGFDYDPAFGFTGTSNTTATYPLPAQAYPSLLTAALVWNLDITGGTNPNSFNPNGYLRDLNIALIDLANGSAVVASSSSASENTENIWFVVPANAQYALRVTRTGNFTHDFGLAWQLMQDTDGDGAYDGQDNCLTAHNGPMATDSGGNVQLDADGDGFGNTCDADLNNSGMVTSADYALLRSVLGLDATAGPLAAAADLNGSGAVTAADFAILRNSLNLAPGP